MNIDEIQNQQVEGVNTSIIEKQEGTKSAEKNQKRTEDLTHLVKPPVSSKNETGKKRITSAPKYLILVIIVLVVAGYIFYSKTNLMGLKTDYEPKTPDPSKISKAAEAVRETAPKSKPPNKQDQYQYKLAEAATLQDELLKKKEDILDLKLYYQNGINEIKQVIIEHARNDQIYTYAQAIKNKPIELHLRIIQRRLAYLDKLDQPLGWVEQASEELLYLTRKMQIDLALKDVVTGIDFEDQARHLNTGMQMYRPNAEKLAIDLNDMNYHSLKSIWNQLESQIRQNPKVAIGAGEQDISQKICAGQLNRTTDLTTISVDAAKCLAKMNTSDLFLNQLTTLTPAAAKHLFQWQGDWICLNGFRKLSPSVARYLFKFKGNWISLNGLIEFPPPLAVYLLNWKGQKLELMGLKPGSNENSLNHLIRWEKSGGKLYVSEEVRKEMQGVI